MSGEVTREIISAAGNLPRPLPKFKRSRLVLASPRTRYAEVRSYTPS